MANSLIDLNSLTDQNLRLAGLIQQQQRNQIEQERTVLQRQAQDRISATNAFKHLGALRNSPEFMFNKDAQIQMAVTQAQLVKQLYPDLEMPGLTPKVIAESLKETDRLLNAIVTGTEQERDEAALQMFLANPEFFDRSVAHVKTLKELPDALQALSLTMETKRETLELLKKKNMDLGVQEEVYGSAVTVGRELLHLIDDPSVRKELTALSKLTEPERAKVFERYPHKLDELKRAKQTLSIKLNGMLQASIFALSDQAEKVRAYQAADPHGVAPPAEIAKLTALQDQRDFFGAMDPLVTGDWLQGKGNLDPLSRHPIFDAKAVRAFRSQLQTLEVKAHRLGAARQSIADERLALMERNTTRAEAKDAAARRDKEAQTFLEQQFTTFLSGGMDVLDAQQQAAEETAKRFPNASYNINDLRDPRQRGRVTLQLGSADVSRNLKEIETAQNLLDYVGDLTDLIEQNPAIVGRGAQFGAAVAGAGQQLRAIVGADPQGAKFLNTKTRDNAEAFYEVLVYLTAKTMDPTGALDLKVVQHAREVIGDLDSLTTGPQQMLNKLQTIKMTAERNLRRARTRVKGGVGTYLDEGLDKAPPAPKPVGEMTLEELMGVISGGTP